MPAPRILTRVPALIPRPPTRLPDATPPIALRPSAVPLRPAARLASEALSLARRLVRPGASTALINNTLHAFITNNDAYPSPLGYYAFPASVCVSVNDVLVHGIPSDDCILRDGDLVSVDVTVYKEGYHGDTCYTFPVGGATDLDEDSRRLLRAARTALNAGIDVVGPGVPFTEIARAITKVADEHGVLVSREFTGHGIGEYFHEPPLVYHHLPNSRNTNKCDKYQSEDDDDPVTRNADGTPLRMLPGMTFTIEPVLTLGRGGPAQLLDDGWTVVSRDGARAAQFEHTVYITETGHEVLTKWHWEE